MTTPNKYRELIEAWADMNKEEIFLTLSDNEELLTPELMETIASMSSVDVEDEPDRYQNLIDNIASYVYLTEIGSMVNHLIEAENPEDEKSIIVEYIDLISPEAIFYISDLYKSLQSEPEDEWMKCDDVEHILEILKPISECSLIMNQLDDAFEKNDNALVQDIISNMPIDENQMMQYLELWENYYTLNDEKEDLEHIQAIKSMIG